MPQDDYRECWAWPLPPEGTSAQRAREILRNAAVMVGLPESRIDDAVTMVSELVTNAYLHGVPQQPGAGGTELWLYRRLHPSCEIVCKVFDALPGRHPAPGRMAGPDDVLSEHGRGLQVVAALSDGRWGAHLSRARLGGRSTAGKVVWFAMPFGAPVPAPRPPLSTRAAAHMVAAQLVERGIDGVRRCDGAGVSVISVRTDLTVWCHNGAFLWRDRTGTHLRRSVADLTDAVEEIVRCSEELGVPQPRPR